MGSMHRASCTCGFHTDVTVGGAMSDFLENAPFPFYCERCGLVEANTAQRPIVCPTCGRTDIHQYGEPPVSAVRTNASPVLQNFSFEAFSTKNLCPAVDGV